eukprot:1370747-Amorphochlora_amoeboformis.AAC.2
MNFEVFVLPAIEVQGTGALEAILQGVFHTIIFNRSLYSKCCPREREMDIFEVSYAVSENKEVDKLVFEGIRSFLRKMDEGKTKTGWDNLVGRIERSYELESKYIWEMIGLRLRVSQLGSGVACLEFYTVKDEPWGIFKYEKKTIWEKWKVPVSISKRTITPPQSSEIQASQQEMIRHCLTQIIKKVNTKRSHIPPKEASKDTKRLGCSPFAIKYDESSNSIWDGVKQVLKNPPKLM